MNSWLLAGIAALLPISALITVWQRRPAFALLARGMMGGVATLLYAVLGAPDVALTEALMGTFLVVLLYAITVRATLVVRVAVVSEAVEAGPTSCDPAVGPLRACCHRHHLEVEFLPMEDPRAAGEALADGRVDAAFGDPAHLWPAVGLLCETPAASDGPVLFLGRRLSRAPRIFTDSAPGINVCRTKGIRTP
ncbi:MAG: hydrogenase subunit MbhD domain-containing protein [Desulfococcaceae bacterium]